MFRKYVFCTCCRNRLGDLRQTLSVNLARMPDNATIVVLDYNGGDGAAEWARSEFGVDMRDGRLKVYKETQAPRWFHSHAKNVCHRLAASLLSPATPPSDSVLVNLDADNFLTEDYVKHLTSRPWARTTNNGHLQMICPQAGNAGFMGRNAILASSFFGLGGYDESMIYGYGYEDIDLVKRAQGAGLKVEHHAMTHAETIETQPADKASGNSAGVSLRSSNDVHAGMSRHSTASKAFVANRSRPVWGDAVVFDEMGSSFRSSVFPGVPVAA